MTRDYSRKEVLEIIEREAAERGIPRDDFLRFAYIETGGRFDEQASRGAAGAKGLFQFVPGTAAQYGIAGRELDAVVNTDAAARLYLDNQRSLVAGHANNGRRYLGGGQEPDGLDMYVAHQQGVGGYQSIQAAIATGSFSRSSTRANILNNISSRDVESITGHAFSELGRMSDRDLANTFTDYWSVKFDRIQIPELGITPVVRDGATVSAPAQPDGGQRQEGIVLARAYQMTLENDHVRYGFGAKDPAKGTVDCSGWVVAMQNATMKEINAQAGRAVYSDKDLFSPGFDAAATIVEKAQQRSGILLEGKAITVASLREGMIIGEDNGSKGWDAGRYRGIDHITMVVRHPTSGALMVSQSRGGEGVELMPLDRYLEQKQARGAQLFATDPLARARELLRDGPSAQLPGTNLPGTGGHEPAQGATELLRHGAKGAAVTALQEDLNRLGYRDVDGKALVADGNFGDRTEQALRAYQKAHGLTVDGIAGARTLGALEKSEQLPMVSEPNHPHHGMYQQAVKGLEQLGPGMFRSRQELEQAAGALVFDARVTGLERIDHVVASRNGAGLFAVQGELSDPAHSRIHVDKAQATTQSLEQSSRQLQQEGLNEAVQQQRQQVQEQETRQRAMLN